MPIAHNRRGIMHYSHRLEEFQKDIKPLQESLKESSTLCPARGARRLEQNLGRRVGGASEDLKKIHVEFVGALGLGLSQNRRALGSQGLCPSYVYTLLSPSEDTSEFLVR